MQVDAGAVAPKPRTRTTHTPDGKYQFALSEDGLLGTGSHGVVRSARHTTTGEWVAVKLMPASILSSVAKELIAQSTMVHPNIVRLYGTQVDLDKRRVYMVMELATGGELFDRIAECGGLVEEEARRYFVQILLALRHCHRNRVFHRDLKPENILLDTEDNAKLADFGLAAVYKHVVDDASFLQHTKVRAGRRGGAAGAALGGATARRPRTERDATRYGLPPAPRPGTAPGGVHHVRRP